MNDLDEKEIRGLEQALDDEYRAWAKCDGVVEEFGEVSPFVDIRDAEARHIYVLLELFERYGVPAPENPWPGRVPHHRSVGDACEARATAEAASSEMYKRLLETSEHADVIAVFRRLEGEHSALRELRQRRETP